MFSSWAARLPKRGARAALVLVLLGAILAFGVGSFTSAAHAASARREIAKTARVEILTHRALSIQVVKVGNPVKTCYTASNHTVTLTG